MKLTTKGRYAVLALTEIALSEDKNLIKISEIAKSQNNFKDAEPNHKSVKGNLVVFDYEATSEGKKFKGNEGKSTQLILIMRGSGPASIPALWHGRVVG